MKKAINWFAEFGLLAFFVIFLCGIVTFLSIGHAMPWVGLRLPGCIWLVASGMLLILSIFSIGQESVK